ncbi:MAG: PHP domain-containing protein [Candidatus Latescibacteria bacterium]|jgi:predicted metal-dependent phosphoesterase TrpH|nr:PHP domain-containing protein [Candidatus Latescibacterota bacterium]
MIDLHIHSTLSDGRDTPEGIVACVCRLGLKAFAITDHDSVKSLAMARKALPSSDGPILVSGVEISAFEGTSDIHVLGYHFDDKDHTFVEALAHLRDRRKARAQDIVAHLNQLGLNLTYSDVLTAANGAAVTRPHIAQALLKSGLVNSYGAAFRDYLANGRPACVPHQTISPKEAIQLIHNAGGVAILAHPGATGRDELIRSMVHSGLDGLEVWHPYHCQAMIRFYKRLAIKYSLKPTGGSDTHGFGSRADSIGVPHVPWAIHEHLHQTAAARLRQR